MNRLTMPVNFEYYTCVIGDGSTTDTDSVLSLDELFSFAKIHKEDIYSQASTSWFISLKDSADAQSKP